MSEIRVDKIVSSSGSGAVEFTQGISLPAGSNVNTSGIITASSVVATTGTFSGNVTVGGQLTYEDVVNVDSIGIATARSGLRVTGGGLDVVGVSTFNGAADVKSTLKDYFGNVGAASSVLISTGSGIKWEQVATAALQGPAGSPGPAGPSGTGAIAGCNGTNFLSCNTCAPNISSGTHNFFVGQNAGICLTSGNFNNFLGYYAGRNNTTGNSNNFFGADAGFFNTTGIHNNFLGDAAGRNNTSGTHNTFIGRHAGYSNTTGCYNNFFGRDAGYCNTIGCNNVFLGRAAGEYNVCGCRNAFIGYESGCLITGGCNVVIGSFNGTGFANCCNHIFLADGAGNRRLTFNGSGAIAFGSDTIGGTCGYVLTSCGNGTAPVWAAAAGGGGGSSAIAGCNGTNFLSCNTCAPNITSAANNFLVGCNAGRCITNGCDNTFIGRQAGQYNTTGCNNFFAGMCAGYCNTTGCYNTAIGKLSGKSLSEGCYNTFIGRSAGCSVTTGCDNILIGRNSGPNLTTGSCNVFIGVSAGFMAPGDGCHNFFSGFYAGSMHGGCYNTFLGFSAGYGQYGSSVGSCNQFFGYNSGQYNTTGCNNNFMGSFAGLCNTSGSNNIFAGLCAGRLNTTGCNNIAIGRNSGNDPLYDLTGASNIIVMGNCAHTASYVQVDWTIASDQRDKTNIIPIPVGKDFLKQLNPVQYQWADRETGEVTYEKPSYGFLAQDVLALEGSPEVIVDNHDPEHLKLRQSMIVPILVKTVQELIEEVDALKEEVRILKGE